MMVDRFAIERLAAERQAELQRGIEDEMSGQQRAAGVKGLWRARALLWGGLTTHAGGATAENAVGGGAIGYKP